MIVNKNTYAPEADVSFLHGLDFKSLAEGATYLNYMDKICGIYKITSPTGKVYVGQSVNCLWREYLYSVRSCKHQPRLFNSINKYGWKNHVFEILENCSKDQLNEREIYYISLFDTCGTPHGLNLRHGGEQGGCMSAESKKKVGDKNRGRVRTKKQRKRQSDSMRNSSRVKRKIVYQFDESGKFIQSFKCAREASEILKLSISGIRDCCKKYQTTAYGFYWSYDKEFIPKKETIKCKWCATEIEKSQHNKLFCSHNCWEQNYKVERADYLKIYNKIKYQKRKAKMQILKNKNQ